MGRRRRSRPGSGCRRAGRAAPRPGRGAARPRWRRGWAAAGRAAR